MSEYKKNTWIDHIEDAQTGEVFQEGTLFTAKRMNHIEEGIENAYQKLYYASNSNLELIAHRGLSKIYPEGTSIAFLNCIKRNEADSVEFDIRWSKDDEFFVFHDTTVDRTTDGTGAIKDLTNDEIRALDHGSYLSSTFEGTVVPYLGEALSVLRGLDVKYIYPQINVGELGDLVLAKQHTIRILDLINWYGLTEKTIIQCVGYGSITTQQIASIIRAYNKDIKILLMVDSNETSLMSNAEWCASQEGRFFLGASKDYFLNDENAKETVAKIKDMGLDIIVWTVNDFTELKKLRKVNINKIMTDINMKGVL